MSHFGLPTDALCCYHAHRIVWVSIYGVRVCGECVTPAYPELVVRWEDRLTGRELTEPERRKLSEKR